MAEIAGSPPRFEVAGEDSEKLFIVGRDLAVATHGQAEIGGRMIADLMREFDGPTEGGTEPYAVALGQWISEGLSRMTEPRRGPLLRADGLRWPLGFVVVGFDDGVGRVREVRVRSGDYQVEVQQPSTENPGVYPFGLSDGIDRLLTGIDLPALKEAKVSISAEDEPKLGLLAYDLIVPDSVDDAVEFAESLVQVQLLAQRISWKTYVSKELRVPGCGGRIRSAAVTETGARWARSDPAVSPRNPGPETRAVEARQP